MKILVTGASGYIGGTLLGGLAGRGELFGTSRTPGERNPGASIVWIGCDLLAENGPEALIARVRPDVLVHAAWHTKAGSYYEDRENFTWLDASERLLDAFIAAGGRRFVGIGSCAEYVATDGPCHETETALATHTAYADSKARFFARLERERESGRIETSYARLFFVYGPGEKPTRLVPSVIVKLLRGEPAETGPGNLRRDFIAIDDAIEALIRLVLGNVLGPVNIGSGTATPIGDIVARIGALIGRPDLLRIGALPPRASEPELSLADIRRLRDELFLVPKTDLEQGLADYVTWCRNGLERHRACAN